MAISGLPPPPEITDPGFKGWLFQFTQLAAAVSASLQAANNLSDLASASTARTNLGLGSLATVSNLTGDVTSAGAATTIANVTALGTPGSGTLTNCTGLPVSTGVSGLGSGVASFLATPSSANLAAALTDETGSGAAVFATSPTLTTPNIGAATGTSLAATGKVSSSGATAGIGYATGAGGSIGQATSKSTSVTINHACGQITMNSAALAAGAKVSFIVANGAVAATDGVIVWVVSSVTANSYRASVTAVGSNQFNITVENITTGSLSDGPVLGFAVIKAVTV